MTKARHVAIVGAGVAGLAAAIALARTGVETTILERDPPRAAGGGLWLFANATKALGALGLDEAVLARSTVVRRHRICSWSGETLWQLPLEEFSGRTQEPPLVLIDRRQLLAVLRDAVGPERVRSEMVCSGFAEHGDGVRPVFFATPKGGAPVPERFDALLGADGFRSVVRRQLLGPDDEPARYPVAWAGRAVTDAAHWPFEPGESVTFLGEQRLLSAGTLAPRSDRDGDARQILWFASERGFAAGRPIAGRADLERRFHPRVATLMTATRSLFTFPIRDRHPVRQWGRGRVTLIGDAAHPATPDLSQGAGQALEGAVVLARSLKRHADIPQALRRYEARRIERTAYFTRLSRAMSFLSWLPVPDGVRKMGAGVGVALLRDVYCKMLEEDFGEDEP